VPVIGAFNALPQMRNKGLPLIELTRLSETLKRSPGHPLRVKTVLPRFPTVLANCRGLLLLPTVIVVIIIIILVAIFIIILDAAIKSRREAYHR